MINVIEPHPNDVIEIKEIKDLKFSRSDFIVENKGKFTESYKFGRSLGKGDLGEIRVWVNISTGTIRAVKIYK